MRWTVPDLRLLYGSSFLLAVLALGGCSVMGGGPSAPQPSTPIATPTPAPSPGPSPSLLPAADRYRFGG